MFVSVCSHVITCQTGNWCCWDNRGVKKRLKIPKEIIEEGRTIQLTNEKKKAKGQTMIYKTLHRKLKIELKSCSRICINNKNTSAPISYIIKEIDKI